jgi:hypothetical protein
MQAKIQDMQVKAAGYDFAAAHAAMRRLVDGDILPGVSSAVLVGRDLVDVNCVGWADKEARIPLRTDPFVPGILQYQADHVLRGAAAVRGGPLPAR